MNEGRSAQRGILRRTKRSWHGVKLAYPDWSSSSHSTALSTEAPSKRASVSHHPECVLGGARFRAAGGGRPWSGYRGGDGSTRLWARQTISWNGRQRRRCWATAIEQDLDRWSCSSRASDPGPVQICDRAQRRSDGGLRKVLRFVSDSVHWFLAWRANSHGSCNSRARFPI